MEDKNTCLETKEPKEVSTSDIDPNAPKREIQIISKENEQFILTIFQSKDSLIFIASKKDDIKAIKYKNSYKITNFHDSHKYFNMFKDIGELFTDFITDLNDNEFELSCKDQKVIVKIEVRIRNNIVNFIAYLKPEEPKAENIVLNLCDQYQSLQNQIDELKVLMNEQMKSNEGQKKMIEELKDDNGMLKQKIKEQMTINESMKQMIDELKKENQKQKEEYQKEMEHLKKQNEEILSRLNKAEKDINLILNRSAPYQLQILKQISENQNSIKIIQTQNQNQNEKFLKTTEKIQNQINKNFQNDLTQNQTILTEINQNSKENQTQNQIQKKLETFQKEIKEIKENFEYFNKTFFKEKIQPNLHKLILFNNMKSDIIKYEELDLIEEGIRKNFNKRIKEYRLLFKGKRDGFGSKDFHSKCDNKRYTVSFVKSKEGRRFGGFTDVEWDQSGSYKKGANGFIFSLDNNEIYYNKNSNYNIYCHSSYGPTFGGGPDFGIYDNCDKNNKSYSISFVESKEGRRFGGFTDVEWDQSVSYKEG